MPAFTLSMFTTPLWTSAQYWYALGSAGLSCKEASVTSRCYHVKAPQARYLEVHTIRTQDGNGIFSSVRHPDLGGKGTPRSSGDISDNLSQKEEDHRACRVGRFQHTYMGSDLVVEMCVPCWVSILFCVR